MSRPEKHLYGFGRFRLDPAERVLYREGKRIPLALKVFETLRVLVENHGRIVEKDDLMKQVWPDTFVEEGNLTVNIFQLRKLLSDGSSGTQFIETVPRRGYQFVAPVEERSFNGGGIPSNGSAEADSATSAQLRANGRGAATASTDAWVVTPQSARARPRRGRIFEVALISGLTVVAVSLAMLWLTSTPGPRVVRTVQITHSGRADVREEIATDGVRLYFVERNGGHRSLAQVSVSGGDSAPISTPFPNATLFDISPNHSELLVGSTEGTEANHPVWIQPLLGGTPRRLGSIAAWTAAWSPDGQRIAYANDADVYLANADGSESRKLVSSAGTPLRIRWSPDGRLLRFTVGWPTEAVSLWEVGADGSNLHALLPGWTNPLAKGGEGQCCGAWTADGKYYVFHSHSTPVSGEATSSLWTFLEKPALLNPNGRKPVQLYEGTLGIGSVLPSPDGKRIFFAGQQLRRELVRYDARVKKFLPHLNLASTGWVIFSRDGEWVAYVASPDRTLWRSKADGSQRLQLTAPPVEVFNPAWSPDGKRIAFRASRRGKPNEIRVVSIDGGDPEILKTGSDSVDDPNWFPDGKMLLFRGTAPKPVGEPEGEARTYRLDLKSGKISVLPGSKDLAGPRLSPDGRFVVAAPPDSQSIRLFDFKTQKWSELARGIALSARCWSMDGKYVYYQDYLKGVEQPIFRVRITDHRVERVTTSKQIPRSDVFAYSFAGLVPDDSPLATVVQNSSDIYALDVDLP